MAELSNYLENAIINYFFRNQVVAQPTAWYVSLHTASPTDTATSTEVVGGSYARLAVTIGAPADGVAANTTALTWTAMPAATLTHGAIWDDLTAGNMLMWSPLSANVTIVAGDNFAIGIGGLTITLA